jgi:peptidoglycan/xylan/chitin deacetylase (PgdA/CDA1 family)
MYMVVLFLAAFLSLPIHSAVANTQITESGSTIILSYQRIDEETYTDTNTQLDQFLSQIAILQDEGFEIISLPTLVNAIETKTALPKKSVVITFDAGYASTEPALIKLLGKDIPFTLFLSLGAVSRDSSPYLSVESLKRLQNKFNTVTFALTAYNYARLNSEEAIRASINDSKTIYRQIFKEEPKYFAYPFGEYNDLYQSIVKEQHFSAAVAMHSSPAYGGSDLFALPRYAMSEEFANPDRFKLIINTKPLPVTAISPTNPELSSTTPNFGFTVQDPEYTKKIRCYISGQGEVPLTVLDNNRVEIRLTESLSDNRVRLNCTAPTKDNKYLWFGRLFTLQQDVLPELQE